MLLKDAPDEEKLEKLKRMVMHKMASIEGDGTAGAGGAQGNSFEENKLAAAPSSSRLNLINDMSNADLQKY